MRRRALALLVLLASHAAGAAVQGSVRGSDGTVLPGVYVALMSPEFALLGDGLTGADGAFAIAQDAASGFLIVQPPTAPDADGLEVFRHQPRIFTYAGETELNLSLLPAVNLILEAYDASGKRMRWQDFTEHGTHGGQFLYATNLDDEMIPATIWPVHGEAFTGMRTGPREEGLPAVLLTPGETASISVLFWETAGYGKLQVRADNAGKGFALPTPGDSLRLNLNAALAESAMAVLEARQPQYPSGGEEIAALRSRLDSLPVDPKARAAGADAILADSLRLRDTLELARAQAAIPAVRQGGLRIALQGAENPADYTVKIEPIRRGFLFGAYEGSPYNGDAWKQARGMGFELATVLPAWNWTRDPKNQQGALDRTFGFSALKELGFDIKAHGVVWMQGYGIMPDDMKTLPPDELQAAALEHQAALLETLDPQIAIWEIMNEPATTNVPGLPRDNMFVLFEGAAEAIRGHEKPTLVNNPHEFSFGAKYFLYRPDGTPDDAYPETYSVFLQEAADRGLMDNVDIIGLQFYPGFHLNVDFGNQEGPAYTPSYLLDTIERYARFGKSVHVTELSLPSSYGDGWKSGYWRQPWDEATQADYAEMVYTMAFASPQVHSLTWWDISDQKPSVVTGAIIRADGTPKPVAERLEALMADWTTNVELAFDEDGAIDTRVFGGTYAITVTGPDFERTLEHTVLEGWNTEIVIEAGASP
ncbi:MAG: hypothetical protein GC168_04895 [Candidatus Hydrogenedens sp.]|nr:hypothetical protein [Candidatus Hydrogenedens sp.]